MLMFAYGSNLNVEAMHRRCPDARKVGRFHLTNARLVFRGVADVEYARGESCPGGLWEVTPQCEANLDRYEGVDTGLYSRVLLKVRMTRTNQVRQMLVYQMNQGGVMPPGEVYLGVIEQGYRDFDLDLAYLDQALARSWDEKDKTRFMRRRRMKRRTRDGALARRPVLVDECGFVP